MIQSVDRAARILEALAGGPRRLGVSELAERLGLSRPTVHGLLQTLQAHGFVEQDRDSDKYQLGAGLLQLGNSYLDLNELRGRSIVHAERLAERTQAAVRVGVMHGANIVVVHHVFRPDAAFQVLEVGAQLPLHASALGKAMLAYSAPEVLDDLLEESPPKLTSR
jgi:DNA-binding IclR family transcriptional regulator